MTWRDLLYLPVRTSTLRAYLLGELKHGSRTRLEQAYFQSAWLYERMKLVEEDLISAYVQRHLSPSARQRFEREYLTSPERAIKVERTRLVTGAADVISAEHTEVAPSRKVHVTRTMITAMLVLLASVSGLTMYWFEHRVVVVRIGSSSMRGDQPPHIDNKPPVLSWMTTTVHFQIEPRDRTGRVYAARLLDDGRVIWQGALQRANDTSVLDLELPASGFRTGTYEVLLQPISPVRTARPQEFRFELRR
jgi:hypothetical protein